MRHKFLLDVCKVKSSRQGDDEVIIVKVPGGRKDCAIVSVQFALFKGFLASALAVPSVAQALL